MQNAETARAPPSASPSAFCILHSAFWCSPPHPRRLRPPAAHARQLLLLLLLHRAQQRVGIRLPLRLVRLLVARRRRAVGLLLLLLLLRRAVRVLLLPVTRQLLLLLFSAQRNLEVALRLRVARPHPQHLGVIADGRIERVRCQRAVAAIEERIRAQLRIGQRFGQRRRALLPIAVRDLRRAEVVRGVGRFADRIGLGKRRRRLIEFALRVLRHAARRRRVRARRPRQLLPHLGPREEEQQRDHSAPRFAIEPSISTRNANASGHWKRSTGTRSRF